MSSAGPAPQASTPPGAASPGAAEARPWKDPRSVKVHRPVPARDVPYVPTEGPVVDAILDFAGVGPGDVLFDLGCGDGRVVISAALRGATGVGVDIDRLRVSECHWNARRAGPAVTKSVRFMRGSLFDVDLRPASVVMLYLLPSINRRLRPKLLWELAPGSRVVSNFFDMGQWNPDDVLEIHRRVLYRWTIPAWVEGDWDCVMDGPGRRQTMVLRLGRKYQVVSGVAQVGRREVPVRDAALDGGTLSFTLDDPGPPGRRHFIGVLGAGALRGRWRNDEDDGAGFAWCAWRRPMKRGRT